MRRDDETRWAARRRIGAMALAGALVLETGCGAAAPPPQAATPPAPAVAMAPEPSPDPSGGSSDRGGAPQPGVLGAVVLPHETSVELPHASAMLVYTVHLTMAVYHVRDGMTEVQSLAERSGGYLSSRSDGALTVRVPRDHFAGALLLIEKVGDVLHRDLRAEDVSDAYVDAEARLRNARAMRDRLEALLQRAPVKEAIEIQRELGHVTEEIERLEGHLRLLRDQVAFSTITVSFETVRDQTVHDTSLLAPFPWLEGLGLQTLLDVHQ